jgi:uncharacterized membrane protein YhaH (DUF805 family)
MNFDALFLRFEGRITRKAFWIGMIALVVFGLVILGISKLVTGEGDYAVIRFNIFAIETALLYPISAVGVKRLHDRGRPGYTILAFLFPWMLHQITNMVGITGDLLALNMIDITSFLINLALFFWFMIDLGFRRGTVGPNEYGPDPVEART